MVTILYQDLHSRSGSGWYRLEVPYRAGTTVKQYMRVQPGLVGMIRRRKLKRRTGLGTYEKVRSSYVPIDGEVLALTPKEW